MKKILSMALTAMMAVSCAEAQDVAFTVEGTAPQGVDTLYVFYNGQMNEAQPIAAKEGKFEVKGNQPAETFITVAASNQLMVAAVIDGTNHQHRPGKQEGWRFGTQREAEHILRQDERNREEDERSGS